MGPSPDLPRASDMRVLAALGPRVSILLAAGGYVSKENAWAWGSSAPFDAFEYHGISCFVCFMLHCFRI